MSIFLSLLNGAIFSFIIRYAYVSLLTWDIMHSYSLMNLITTYNNNTYTTLENQISILAVWWMDISVNTFYLSRNWITCTSDTPIIILNTKEYIILSLNILRKKLGMLKWNHERWYRHILIIHENGWYQKCGVVDIYF